MNTITFTGPFCWHSQKNIPSVFDSAEARQSGIYLWSVPQPEGEYVYYVGETGRTFAVRMLEHLKEHLSGFYQLYEPDAFQKGRKQLLWPGRYDPDQKASIDEIIDNHIGVANTAATLAVVYRFYLATTENDTRLRKRIEASLSDYLRTGAGGIPDYQDKGIHYSRRSPAEMPIKYKVISPSSLKGMPIELDV